MPGYAAAGGEFLREREPLTWKYTWRSLLLMLAITELDAFNHAPWNSTYLQGIVDALLLNLTPGTRINVQRENCGVRDSMQIAT